MKTSTPVLVFAMFASGIVGYFCGYTTGRDNKHLEWCKAFHVDKQSDASAVATFSSAEENDELVKENGRLMLEMAQKTKGK